MNASRARYRIGVDVGGTHTDLVLLDTADGTLAIEKVATTPDDPARAVLEGVRRFAERGFAPEAVGFFSHGTTITTNALLEMRGARTGMLVTEGYRAIQEVQTQARDGNPFDYFFRKPEPIAPQSLTREVGGRIDFEGAELAPLDEDAVARAAESLREAGVRSIAVCYLFSFMNPAHERRSREIVARIHPEASVSLSSDVLPRIREWPRMSTTLLNAFLEPVLTRYVGELARGLDRAGARAPQRFLMQSNGGVMPFAAVAAGGRTVHTLLSGPAAGATASAFLAGVGEPGLVTLDMGGTSCDIAFIEDGAPLEVTESVIARRPVGVPALDLTTISAGGGSIAWIDAGGLLAVGPRSAGAEPGPACYGKGGADPTVTDADVVCGCLNPRHMLGGAQPIDAAAAEAALAALGARLGMTAPEAAAGIRRIVDMRMADEVRVAAARRGVDPRDFTLLPFGGAGAVHAAAVAEELGIARILVPERPGAFSALGLLCADVVHDYVRSELRPLARVAAARVEAAFAALEDRARAELAAEGLDPGAARHARELDLRYVGQGYELRVPLDGLGADGLAPADMEAARARFDDLHARIHGHAAREKDVEIVSYRLRSAVQAPKYRPRPAAAPAASALPGDAVTGRRAVRFDSGAAVETPVVDRARLPAGTRFVGPAIVEQFDATTVVPAGWRAAVDGRLDLALERGSPGGG